MWCTHLCRQNAWRSEFLEADQLRQRQGNCVMPDAAASPKKKDIVSNAARESNSAGPRESKRQRQLVLHKLEKLAASTPYLSEAETARAKIEQLKIHRVIVQVPPATDGGNPGEVAIRHYVVE